MDQLSPLGDLFKNKKEESHGISFDPIHGDSVKIPFQKEKVRNNWDFLEIGCSY